MFKRILVPLDGSRFGSTALKYAIDLAERYQAAIILMHAAVPSTPAVIPATADGTMSTTVVQATLDAARLEDRRNTVRARRYLQRKAREVSSRGITCSYRNVIGGPAGSIMELCRTESIDLIVMSSSGKGGLKRVLMGSVSDEVVRRSRVPVLLIRPAGRQR